MKHTGLVAAPFTAMNANGSLNLALIPKQAQAFAENRVSGAFICGTTGEWPSLATSERFQIAEAWMQAAPSSLRVIVHVGSNSLPESQVLAKHAESIKAAAFAAIAPAFLRSASVDQLVEYCAEIAGSAPKLPFFYYHMPAMTGLDLPMHDFLAAAGSRIPNLAGIKFTHENLMDYSRCLAFEGGKYNILFGRDEILLAALAMGAQGAVGSTYNYMPAVYHKIVKAFEANAVESARHLQSKAIQVIAIMSKYGGLPAGKAMMKLIGLDCGPVRSPLKNLSAEAFESLSAELAAVGFPDDLTKLPRERVVPPVDRAATLKRLQFLVACQ